MQHHTSKVLRLPLKMDIDNHSPVRQRPIGYRSLEKRPKRESWDLSMEGCRRRGSRCAQPRDINHFSKFLEEKQSKITRYRSRMLEGTGAETLS